MWQWRSTHLADLQALLTPHSVKLQREEKLAHLDKFFVEKDSDDSEDGEEDWKATFVSEGLELEQQLREMMMATIQNKTLPHPESLFGWKVILGTSLDWRNVDSKSRKAQWTAIAKSAVVENTRMDKFIEDIVTNTSVARFRTLIEHALSKHAIPETREGKTYYKWRFYDGYRPSKDIPEMSKLSFLKRLSAVDVESDWQTHRGQIDRIFRLVRKQGVSRIDKESTLVEQNIGVALNQLIKVRLTCSCSHRLTMLHRLSPPMPSVCGLEVRGGKTCPSNLMAPLHIRSAGTTWERTRFMSSEPVILFLFIVINDSFIIFP
jgi:hypothetical protein